MDVEALATALQRVTFPQALMAIDAHKYTGPVTFHFAEGKPNAVELPARSTKYPLDKRDRRAQA